VAAAEAEADREDGRDPVARAQMGDRGGDVGLNARRGRPRDMVL
jgi:hypothetical protein